MLEFNFVKRKITTAINAGFVSVNMSDIINSIKSKELIPSLIYCETLLTDKELKSKIDKKLYEEIKDKDLDFLTKLVIENTDEDELSLEDDWCVGIDILVDEVVSLAVALMKETLGKFSGEEQILMYKYAKFKNDYELYESLSDTDKMEQLIKEFGEDNITIANKLSIVTRYRENSLLENFRRIK